MAHPHPGAADELLLDQFGVQRPANLVGRLHAEHRDLTRFVIDLDLDDQRRVRETRHRRHLAGLGVDLGQRDQKNAAPRHGLAMLELRRLTGRHGGDGARWRALDMDVATPVRDQIGRIDLELLRSRFNHHGAGLLRGLDDSIADAVGAARGERTHAVRAGVAVSGIHIDIRHWDPERFRRDLPGHGFHTLAQIDRGQGNGEFAVGVGMNQRLRGIAAQVHADGIVDRRKSASAMQGHQRLLKPERDEKRNAPCRGVSMAGAGGAGGTGLGARGAGWA